MIGRYVLVTRFHDTGWRDFWAGWIDRQILGPIRWEIIGTHDVGSTREDVEQAVLNKLRKMKSDELREERVVTQEDVLGTSTRAAG